MNSYTADVATPISRTSFAMCGLLYNASSEHRTPLGLKEGKGKGKFHPRTGHEGPEGE
jgi:hypothetical protein